MQASMLRRSLTLATILVTVVAFVALVSTASHTKAGGSATIAIGSTTCLTGENNCTVNLTVSPAGTIVAALDVDINYDAAVLAVVDASNPTCNEAFDANTIRCSLANLTGLTGVVSSMTFAVIGAGGTSSPLNVVIAGCYDDTGTPITCTEADGLISVQAFTPTPTPHTPTPTPGTSQLWGDMNCDDVVNAIDALAIQRWKVGLPVFQVQPCPLVGEPFP